jgi:hypothetical protein
MKNTSLILASLLSIPSFAQTVSFKPFEFKDSNLGVRSDIKKEYSRQVYQFNQSEVAKLVRDEDTEAKLNLFPETLKLMQHARAMGEGGGQPTRSLNFCGRHVGAVNVPVVSANCSSLQVSVDTAFANISKVCRDVETPEKYMLELPAYTNFDEKLFTRNGLMSLIETAGQSLLQHQWPQGMISQEMADRGRSILLRLRYETLKKQIDDQQNRYYSILSHIAGSPNCISGNVAAVKTTVEGLSTELSAASNYLNQVYAAGLAQAQADQAKVASQGRIRDPLPYPALTDSDREWLSFYVMGVYWRIRGGGLFANIGTQTRRSVFAKFPIEKLVELNCGTKCNSSVRGIGGKMKLKLQLKGWGEWADMGTWQGEGAQDRFHDLTFMTWRGEYQVDNSVTALTSAKFNGAPFYLSGLQMGATYWYPTVTGMKFIIYGPNGDRPTALTNGPWSMGEVFQGATMGLGLARSLLQGHTK